MDDLTAIDETAPTDSSSIMPVASGVTTSDGSDLNVPDTRKNFISKWTSKIAHAEGFWKKKEVWKQMRENEQFAARGATKEWIAGDKYVVPILNRAINQSVAQLYAKNPTVVAKRRRQLMYVIWDGRQDTLEAAMQSAAMGDPQSMAIIQEVLAVRQQELMMDRLGKTLEVLWNYYVENQAANFKQQLKAAVRRAKVCKVAYIKLGYQRILEQRPEITAQIEDITSQLSAIQATMTLIQEGKIDHEEDPRVEELQLMLQDLQSQQTVLVREGLVFDFPRADEIIIDPNCRHLKSLVGAEWFAHKFDMTSTKILEIYKVDVGTNFTQYKDDGNEWNAKEQYAGETKGRVYEVYDKHDRLSFTICEGYPDFLKIPADDLKIERFFPIFPIVFNEVESRDNIYPPSDVESAKHIQNEYNRSREGLRQHRIAARPYYLVAAAVEEEERKKLAMHADHELIVIGALQVGQKGEDLIQRGPVANIDPNLYEVESIYTDILRAIGTQEANLGGTGDATATESSIAQNSSSIADASSIDDLDEVLAELAKEAGHVMLTELDKQTVIEIVGQGAVWPDHPATRLDVSKDLYLDIQAGSSGRPNQSAKLADLERAAPLLIQLPGINPKPIARKFAELLDFDPEELAADALPSIQALNAMLTKMQQAQPTGSPTPGMPGAQGPMGAGNAAPPPQAQNNLGPQPAFPAPAPHP